MRLFCDVLGFRKSEDDSVLGALDNELSIELMKLVVTGVTSWVAHATELTREFPLLCANVRYEVEVDIKDLCSLEKLVFAKRTIPNSSTFITQPLY